MAELHELYDAAEKLKDAGKHDQAVEKLEELLAVDDSYVLAHLALAVIYGQLGRHEDGIRHGQKACEIAQYAHQQHIDLRQAAIQLGYINEADFDRIVDPASMTTPQDQ